MEIALKGMLLATGFTSVVVEGRDSTSGAWEPGDDESFPASIGLVAADRVRIAPTDTASVGIALGVFKALQLVAMGDHAEKFSDFTAIDLETTGRENTRCEIVEIAAVRVRDGRIVDELHAVVRPRVPIEPGATATHGYSEADVADKPYFEEVWPKFREFCGDDVVVAHNGYEFDFRILTRMARELPQPFDLCTYDTLPLARDLFPTSRKLEHLAPMLGVDTGRSHRALDDTRALAQVVIKLDDVKLQRARKTALVNLLDHLGIALALSDDAALDDEGRMFRTITRPYALGRYTTCLDAYEREQGDDASVPARAERRPRGPGRARARREQA